MDVKEKILWYLAVYDGERQGAEKRVEQDLIRDLPRKEHNKIPDMIFFGFMELERKGNIKFIPYNEMTDNQKFRNDREGKTFYRIINKNID